MGSGGVGKTRLALAIAAELADHFGDGRLAEMWEHGALGIQQS